MDGVPPGGDRAPDAHGRLAAAVAMRRTLQSPPPAYTSARAYQEQVARGAIPQPLPALVDAYVAQAGTNAATRSLRRRHLRRWLTWRATRGYACTPGAETQAEVDAYLEPLSAQDTVKAKLTLREWWEYLARHGVAPAPTIAFASGRWVGYRRRAADGDAALAAEIDEFERWLLGLQDRGALTDERTIRMIVASLARLALRPPANSQADASLVALLGDVGAVADYLRTLTRERTGEGQGEALMASSRQRELANLAWAYRYLAERPDTAERMDGAWDRLRAALRGATGQRIALGGAPSPRIPAPTTAQIDDLRERLALAIAEESERCGSCPGDPTPASAVLVGLLLDRALIEVAISSLMRAETLATIDEARIVAQEGGAHYLAMGVRHKRTAGHRDELWTNWALFPAILERSVEPYLHATGRCHARGLPGCAAAPRLGPPCALRAGDTWGDTVLPAARSVTPLWRSVDDPTQPLRYETLTSRLRRWLHHYHRADGQPVRVHDLRHYGAHHDLNELRLPIPWIQAIGHWDSPDVLMRIYAQSQAADALRAVGGEVYPSTHAAGDDQRQRLIAVLPGLERALGEIRSLCAAAPGSPADRLAERVADRLRTAISVLVPPSGAEVVVLPLPSLPLIAEMARVCHPALADRSTDEVLRAVFPGVHLTVTDPPAPPPRRERTRRVPLGQGLSVLESP